MLPSAVPVLPRFRSASGANASRVSNVPPALHVDNTLRRDETRRRPSTCPPLESGRPATCKRTSPWAAPTTLRPNSSRCPRRLHLGHARTGPSCADSRPHVPTPVPGHPGSYGQLPPQASPPVTVGDAWHDGDSSSPPHTDHSAAWLTPHEQPRPTEPDELRQCRPSHDCL